MKHGKFCRFALTVATLAALVVLPMGSAARADDEPKPETQHWTGSFGLGLSLTSGNSDTVLFTVLADGTRQWNKNLLRLGLTVSYGESDNEVNNEKAAAAADYQRLTDGRWYWGGNVSAYSDAIADIELRVKVGPNVGYYFIKTDLTKLSAEIGPSWVIEKTDVEHPNQPAPPPPNPDFVTSEWRNYWALRAGQRFERQLTKTSKIWQALEILPQIDDFNNFIVNAEVGAEAALNSKISLRVVFQDSYDNQPAPGKESNDIALISSVVYKY